MVEKAKKEYRIKTGPETICTLKDPHIGGLSIIHAYVPVRNFPHGKLPDEVNPRSHEHLAGRIPEAIDESLKENSPWFHLLNRGLVVLAQKAWYDKPSQTLHLVLGDDEEFGVLDGATTDRTLAAAKAAVSTADFESLKEAEIPQHLLDARVHLEIIAGEIGPVLVDLARARNTSIQVKEFALENMGGGFEWLKDTLDETEFKDRIRYRENDPEPVDVRQVLGLLTLFHPKWDEKHDEPLLAYTNKGKVLNLYQDDDWRPGYEQLKSVAADILRLYDYVHVHFPDAYEKFVKHDRGKAARLGARKDVRFNERRKYTLPLTQAKTSYILPDGWLYPMLGSLRMLLDFSGNTAKWAFDPQEVFEELGVSMVRNILSISDELKSPQAVGKSRMLWNTLRQTVELKRLNLTDSPRNRTHHREAVAV